MTHTVYQLLLFLDNQDYLSVILILYLFCCLPALGLATCLQLEHYVFNWGAGRALETR